VRDLPAQVPGYDRGEGRRRWRALDLGTVPTWLEADAPRVNCPSTEWWWRRCPGPATGRATPAVRRHGGLAGNALCEVGRGRPDASGVADGGLDRDPGGGDARAATDPLDKLVRIGIDEISYKKGHKYLVVVVDHDTGKLVWAKPGRDKKTLGAFSTRWARSVAGRSARLGRRGGLDRHRRSRPVQERHTLHGSFSCGPVGTDALDEVRARSGTQRATKA